MLPPRQRAAADGEWTGGGGGAIRVSKFDEARTLCAPLSDESYGTNTLSRILTPFQVESVTSLRDGYAALLFPDAQAAAAALAVDHYTPTGKRITLIAARDLRQSREAAGYSGMPSSAAMNGGYLYPMEDGWTAEWSVEYGCYYYTNPSLGVTQWELPKVGLSSEMYTKGIVDYSDDDDEEESKEEKRTTSQPAEATHTAAPIAEGDSAEPEFFYGDLTGSVQGPFALSVMREWVLQGALPPGTPACAVGADEFTTLGELPQFVNEFRTLAGASRRKAVQASASPATTELLEVTAEDGFPMETQGAPANDLVEPETPNSAPIDTAMDGEQASKTAPRESLKRSPRAAPRSAREIKVQPSISTDNEASAAPAKRSRRNVEACAPAAADPAEALAQVPSAVPGQGATYSHSKHEVTNAASEPMQDSKGSPATKDNGTQAHNLEANKEIVPTEKALKAMKVAELRAQCESLGLESSGVKAVLIRRILGTIA